MIDDYEKARQAEIDCHYSLWEAIASGEAKWVTDERATFATPGPAEYRAYLCSDGKWRFRRIEQEEETTDE